MAQLSPLKTSALKKNISNYLPKLVLFKERFNIFLGKTGFKLLPISPQTIHMLCI